MKFLHFSSKSARSLDCNQKKFALCFAWELSVGWSWKEIINWTPSERKRSSTSLASAASGSPHGCELCRWTCSVCITKPFTFLVCDWNLSAELISGKLHDGRCITMQSGDCDTQKGMKTVACSCARDANYNDVRRHNKRQRNWCQRRKTFSRFTSRSMPMIRSVCIWCQSLSTRKSPATIRVSLHARFHKSLSPSRDKQTIAPRHWVLRNKQAGKRRVVRILY